MQVISSAWDIQIQTFHCLKVSATKLIYYKVEAFFNFSVEITQLYLK